MSWHTAAIFINQDFSDDLDGFLKRLGFAGLKLRGRVDAYEVGSIHLNGVAVATAKEWTVAYNSPDMFGSGVLPDLDKPFKGLWPQSVEKQLVEISRKSKALGLLMEGSTGTYGLTWHVDARRMRLFLHHHRKVVFNEGKPLAGEKPPLGKASLANFETVMLSLADRLVPWDSLEFDRYEYKRCPKL